MEVQARKFYSQRNMYLCGFTLFLSLILNRTYTMILEILRLEDKVKMYEGDKRAGGKDSAKLAAAGDIGEIGRLKKELKDRENDIEALKKQSEGLSREYTKLGDEISAQNKDNTPKKDRWTRLQTIRTDDYPTHATLFSDVCIALHTWKFDMSDHLAQKNVLFGQNNDDACDSFLIIYAFILHSS